MSRTIFDDVFRTMMEKLPHLAVPLINEVFHTSYPEDVEITQLRNEHQQEKGIGNIMRGRVLKLKSEELLEEGELRRAKKDAVSLAEIGLSIDMISKGLKVDEKTVLEWLAEKQTDTEKVNSEENEETE